jgi:hypothetical protein
MGRVLLAEGAILVQLKLVRGVLLVLHRIVVSLLALVASQSDFNAHLTAPPYYWYHSRLAGDTDCLPVLKSNPLFVAEKRKTRTKRKPFFTGNSECTTLFLPSQHFFIKISIDFVVFSPLAYYIQMCYDNPNTT